ncbi:MAG: trypsin-like peptidase domain-containing protein [Bacteroidaceae bacterium]|nr:trypsin-like peptidase domain-containing protein [Bacteroidaceae bacterium]
MKTLITIQRKNEKFDVRFRLLLSLLVMQLCPIKTFPQITEQPYVGYQNEVSTIVLMVMTHEKQIHVTIDFQDYITKKVLGYRGDDIVIKPSTYLSYQDPSTGKTIKQPLIQLDYMSSATQAFRSLKIGRKYSTMKDLEGYALLRFAFTGPIKNGVRKISIHSDPFVWEDIRIKEVENRKNVGNQERMDSLLANSKGDISGLYLFEGNQSAGIMKKVAVLVDKNISNDKYLLVAYEPAVEGVFKIGDIISELTPTTNQNVYAGRPTFSIHNSVTFIYKDGILTWKDDDGKEEMMIKIRPNNISENNQETPSVGWTGTGFALNSTYIVTNYHVVENAKKIEVYGINGNMTSPYNANVKAVDKTNDIAILQLKDNYKIATSIPYSINTQTSDVGEKIFVLGYPLTSTMGEEVKLTDGIISSKSGFQGDVSLYQITAPIQPGNSGGPLFDKRGNVIGIVNAKHTGAENVGYAIKASYLSNLVESFESNQILPRNNSINKLELKDQVKVLRNYVYIIKCE